MKSYLVYLSGLFVGILTPARLSDFIKVLYLESDGFSTVKFLFSRLVDRVADLLLFLFCDLLSLFWISQLLHIKAKAL